MLAAGFDRQRNVLQTMAEAEPILGLGPLVVEPVNTPWLANDKAKML